MFRARRNQVGLIEKSRRYQIYASDRSTISAPSRRSLTSSCASIWGLSLCGGYGYPFRAVGFGTEFGIEEIEPSRCTSLCVVFRYASINNAQFALKVYHREKLPEQFVRRGLDW